VELGAVGERVNETRRAFNRREGWTAADDWLPERLLTEPVRGGPYDGAQLTPEWLRRTLAAYHRQRGWEADG
jgi:aldehyde:ferredoxin oxidoreductase